MKNDKNGKGKKLNSTDLPPKQGPMDLEGDFLTSNQGLRISDNHNSLKAGIRGPSLLEDFVLREKITSFDHERIPERVVHARGAGAFGEFVCTKDMRKFTSAHFLTNVGKKTPVFARFSTVGGFRGSADTARDPRGFAIKFYTDEGNYDFVGNNIPVFYIQDAMKFPDLIHSVKPEPNNEIPQASSAHDTFWDFVSLMPESTHMLMWHNSDRAIPRSYRMMEGFGVHTYRFVNEEGQGTFVKLHWKPRLGSHALLWEEAQLLAGLDPDYHRRDLFEAIESGEFPRWDFGVQLVPEADEHKYDFDLLDPTKLIPEELVPVTLIGTLTLNRNPDNYFAEVEQAVFHPGHLVPGIDLTNDPLLQGRLFSYTDTQLTRLGGPNFHEIPVNRPLIPVNNHQRDGSHRQSISKGRVTYEPNSLGGGCPFLAKMTDRSYVTEPERIEGHKVRSRSSSFGDHYSQAKLFFDSQSKPEQDHIKASFIFELSKVETLEIRLRMLQTLMFVDKAVAKEIAEALKMTLPAKPEELPNPADPDNNIISDNRSLGVAQEDDRTAKHSKKQASSDRSTSLSMILTHKGSPATRKVAFLVTEASTASEVKAYQAALEAQKIVVEVVGTGLGDLKVSGGTIFVDKSIASTPSVVYDGVLILTDSSGYTKPEDLGKALKFVGQAFKHCKTIATSAEANDLLPKATYGFAVSAKGTSDAGVLFCDRKAKNNKAMNDFANALAMHKHWDREAKVKALPF